MAGGPASKADGAELQTADRTLVLSPLDKATRGRLAIGDRRRRRRTMNCPGWPRCWPDRGTVQDFLAAVFDLSPFLRDCARRRPEMLDGLFDQTVESRLADILAEIETPRAART